MAKKADAPKKRPARKAVGTGATRRRAKCSAEKLSPGVKLEPNDWGNPVRRKPAAAAQQAVALTKREPPDERVQGAAAVVKRELVEPATSVGTRGSQLYPCKALPVLRRRSKKQPHGLMLPAAHFDDVARRAAELAPGAVARKMGCPLPIAGELTCAVSRFEKALDGIKVDTSWVVFRWRFRHSKTSATRPSKTIEGCAEQRHRAVGVYYDRFLPQPPRAVRVAACVV